MHALNLCDYQVTFAEEVPNLQLVRARPSAQNTTRKIDRRERKLGQERSCNVDLPPPRLNLHNAPDDQIADFWVVASSKGMYREKFVGFLDGAGDGRDDRRGKGGYVSAVASCIVSFFVELSSKADCSAERASGKERTSSIVDHQSPLPPGSQFPCRYSSLPNAAVCWAEKLLLVLVVLLRPNPSTWSRHPSRHGRRQQPPRLEGGL